MAAANDSLCAWGGVAPKAKIVMGSQVLDGGGDIDMNAKSSSHVRIFDKVLPQATRAGCYQGL